MYNYSDDHKDYYLPLRCHYPYLDYDMSLFCKNLKEITYNLPFPDYLKDFQKNMSYYIRNKSHFKPDYFHDEYRIYVLDNRLNVIFIATDKVGDIADLIYLYSSKCLMDEDYHYSDNYLFNPTLITDEQADSYKQNCLEFSKEFDFLPFEQLSLSAVMICKGAKLEYCGHISTFQSYVITSKYKSKNIVDWEELSSTIFSKLNESKIIEF